MYDPLKRATDVARIVCRNDGRKYHRFRPARFYGGIATADCVGCCLRCLVCCSWGKVTRPEASAQFYAPLEVAEKLIGVVIRTIWMVVALDSELLPRDHGCTSSRHNEEGYIL